jgi:membrane-bound serine protease (ClpP class)
VEWYEKAVEESASITGTEAVNTGVVEILARSEDDFLRAIAKEGIPFQGGTIAFDPARVERVTFSPGARHTILSWLLSPQVAYLLLLGGMAGLFFELATPGAVFPGVFGGLCLLLALYALSILPTTAAGVLLILFAMLLFILEVFVTSYGLLAISGLAALFFGSTILFRFEYGFTALPMGIIASTVVGVGCIVFLGVYLVAKAQTIPVRLGPQTLVGKTAVVRTWQNGKGQVLVRGEIWTAEHPEGLPMDEGDTVRVVRTEGLRLIVVKEEGAAE